MSSADTLSLVVKFQNGDLEAFSEIVARYQNQVYETAYNIIRNSEDAHDVSQEVFIKVYKSLSSLKNVPSFETWLHKVTVNTCFDFLRSQTDCLIVNDISLIDRSHHEVPVETSISISDEHKLIKLINETVDTLPNRQRLVFILRYYEDLPLKEIARNLGCSIGTVKAHLFRATQQLRNLLSTVLARPQSSI